MESFTIFRHQNEMIIFRSDDTEGFHGTTFSLR